MNTVPNGFKKIINTEPIEYLKVTVLDWYDKEHIRYMSKEEFEKFEEDVKNKKIKFDN